MIQMQDTLTLTTDGPQEQDYPKEAGYPKEADGMQVHDDDGGFDADGGGIDTDGEDYGAAGRYPRLTLAVIEKQTDAAIARKRLTTGIYQVTPDVAEQVLERWNTDNFRNPSEPVIGRYAALMEAEKWMGGASLLLFDRFKRLQDGQQRCGGVARSGIPQAFVVVFGHRPGVKLVVDNNALRTIAMLLAYTSSDGQRGEDGMLPSLPRGFTNAWRLFRGMTEGLKSGNLSHLEAAAQWVTAENAVFRDTFGVAHRFVTGRADRVPVAPAIKGAFYVYLISVGCRQQDIEEFLEGLALINVGAKALRRKLVEHLEKLNTTGRGGEQDALRVLFYGFNRWMGEGEPEGKRVRLKLPKKGSPVPPPVVATQRGVIVEAADYDDDGGDGD